MHQRLVSGGLWGQTIGLTPTTDLWDLSGQTNWSDPGNAGNEMMR